MKDDNKYPTNPTNGYISQWVDGFQGCLACGSTNHRFSTCPKKDNPNAEILFWQELCEYIPYTRRRKSQPIPKSIVDANPACHSLVVTGAHTLDSIYGNSSPKRPAEKCDTSPAIGKPCWYAIFVRVTNISSSPKIPMPISITNSLLYVCLHLGNHEDDENRMRILVDTGVAMNTGDLKYHQWSCGK